MFGRMLTLLLLLIPAFAIANPVRTSTGDAPPEGGGFICPTQWRGGPNSLPFGMRDAAEVRHHALELTCVQGAIETMTARGYVRRADLDLGATRDGYACAVIAFEKPGFDPLAHGADQPVLIVATKPYFVPEVGFVPTTQVLGMTLRDSSGVFTLSDNPSDEIFAMIGVTSTEAGGALADPGLEDGAIAPHPLWNDEALEFRYTTFETSTPFMFQPHLSPGTQYLAAMQTKTIMAGAEIGAVGILVSFRDWPPGTMFDAVGRVALGTIFGMWSADRMFWVTPPDTTHIH
jgi:hypothetical protein